MSQGEIVGWALIGAGALDAAAAFLVVGPRLPEDRRRIVVSALAAGALAMVGLGACFLARIL